MSQKNTETNAPWWSFGYVWLILLGPAVVVVAGLATLYIALTTPDPLVTEDYYVQGMEINKTLGNKAVVVGDHVPAMQARNHAATGTLRGANPASRP